MCSGPGAYRPGAMYCASSAMCMNPLWASNIPELYNKHSRAFPAKNGFEDPRSLFLLASARGRSYSKTSHGNLLVNISDYVLCGKYFIVLPSVIRMTCRADELNSLKFIYISPTSDARVVLSYVSSFLPFCSSLLLLASPYPFTSMTPLSFTLLNMHLAGLLLTTWLTVVNSKTM